MKKLLCALTCATSVALFAEEESSQTEIEIQYFSFADMERYQVDAPVSSIEGENWDYVNSEGGQDSSRVKAYGGDITAPTHDSKLSDGGNNYLQIQTEGGTLWGHIDSTGEAQDITDFEDNELFFETMVQLSEIEDGENREASAEDKLALWLNAKGERYSLMVQCATVGADGTPGNAANFTLVPFDGNLSVVPNQWYRLSIQATTYTVGEGSNQKTVPYYQIKVNGISMRIAEGNPFAAEAIAMTTDPTLKYAMQQGLIIPPMNAYKEGEPDTTLQGIGFQGTGAIDDLGIANNSDLTWTLPEAQPIAFSITAADGASANLGIAWALTREPDEWTTYAEGATVPPGTTAIFVKLTNGDVVSKIVEMAIDADGENAFSVTDADFGWAEYLGAAVDGAFVIDNKAELQLFLTGFNKGFVTAGTTFKLAANIDLADTAWPGIGEYKNGGGSASAFKGTFDGNGKTISNITFASGDQNEYRGFFNQLEGATVKDLTISGTPFDGFSNSYGGALIAGNAVDSTIEGCTANGTVSGTHNVAGIVVRTKDATLKNCTNNANITGSYTKLAGIVVLNQGSTAEIGSVIEGCVNNGTITAATGTDSARDGLAGIVAYIGDATLTIKNCENKGNLVDNSGSASRIGQIVGYTQSALKTVSGTNKGLAGILAIGDGKKDGLNYATVEDGVATYVADSAVVAGGTYLVTTKNNAPAIELGANETIAFDETLATITKTGITAAEGYELKSEKVGNVTTYRAEAAAPEPEIDPMNPGDVSDEFQNEQDAEAKASAINEDKEAGIALPTAVSDWLNTLEGQAKEAAKMAYYDLFAAKVTDSPDTEDMYVVVIDLTELAQGAVEQQLQAAVAEEALLNPAEDEVTITTKPGLFYWIEGTTDLGQSGPWESEGATLATGTTLTLQKPDLGTTNKAFYRVMMSVNWGEVEDTSEQ